MKWTIKLYMGLWEQREVKASSFLTFLSKPHYWSMAKLWVGIFWVENTPCPFRSGCGVNCMILWGLPLQQSCRQRMILWGELGIPSVWLGLVCGVTIYVSIFWANTSQRWYEERKQNHSLWRKVWKQWKKRVRITEKYGGTSQRPPKEGSKLNITPGFLSVYHGIKTYHRTETLPLQ